MSDNDLIRRGDVLALCDQYPYVEGVKTALHDIPAAQPTVKPLAWLDSQQGRYSESRAIGILYSIRLGSDGVTRWQAGHMGPWHEVASIEAAKAAAQADYEARILSALDMQPTVSPDVAALVEALENVIGEYDLFRKEEYDRGLAPLDDEIHEARAALARVKGAM